ncbi:MAG TPA: phospholipase D family protein [Rhodanobacteraceae bacterium]|nr:phospholipase D family protein [Rhodanobacteraceae bacterium]
MTRRHGLRLLWLIVILLLQGCAVSRENVRRADQLIAANRSHRLDCARADHCATPSALRALGQDGHNQAVILEQGRDALIARLSLIRAATRSIDIQTYIWADDDAGKLVLDELVRAARRGVRVRILADQLGSFNDVEQLARLARTHVNFELRLYNPTLHEAETGAFGYIAGGLCCFDRFNQRMHNKLLLIDAVVGITGGRNYENKYFDWDEAFDFRDRDVVVGGPVAAEMAASFHTFWVHPRAVPLARLRDVNQRLREDGAAAPGWQTPRYAQGARVEFVLGAALDPEYIRQHFLAHVFTLGEVAYFSDLPGKRKHPGDAKVRELTDHLMHLVANTRRELVLQTPYLVISKPAQRIFRRLRAERPEVDILISTNSLASTDAFAVYALSHKYKRRYLAAFGFTIYEFKPHPAEAERLIADFAQLSGIGGEQGSKHRRDKVPLNTKGVRVSIHAKSMVVDGEFAMIGSHNFDPRSDDYNTEAGIIVNDQAFAAALRASILADTRPGNAWVIARRQTEDVLSRINRVFAKLSEKLPIFDLWPIRYATSFELKPGCQPIRPGQPGFYECYRPVGEFPEVALPMKSIYTRIITAFGAGISGVL